MNNIKDYLQELKAALAGADPATIQDALSDAEEYLTDALLTANAENHPEILKTVVQTLNQTTDWVKTYPDDAAKLLEKPTALEFEVLKASISRMGFGVQPISEKVAKEQQYVADAFYTQKLIPKQLVIQDAVLKNDIK